MPALRLLGIFGGGSAAFHGFALVNRTKLPISTVYTILERFEEQGFVRRIDDAEGPKGNRVPRVVYQGTTVAADQLAAIRAAVNA